MNKKRKTFITSMHPPASAFANRVPYYATSHCSEPTVGWQKNRSRCTFDGCVNEVMFIVVCAYVCKISQL